VIVTKWEILINWELLTTWELLSGYCPVVRLVAFLLPSHPGALLLFADQILFDLI
jgi:hypothetical protein